MLADVASLLQKHVVMDDHSVVALALWCVSTYLSDKSILPLQFLGALSPTKRCGRTRLLSVLNRLVRRPISLRKI